MSSKFFQSSMIPICRDISPSSMHSYRTPAEPMPYCGWELRSVGNITAMGRDATISSSSHSLVTSLLTMPSAGGSSESVPCGISVVSVAEGSASVAGVSMVSAISLGFKGGSFSSLPHPPKASSAVRDNNKSKLLFFIKNPLFRF